MKPLRCDATESGGVRCELAKDHDGPHDCQLVAALWAKGNDLRLAEDHVAMQLADQFTPDPEETEEP